MLEFEKLFTEFLGDANTFLYSKVLIILLAVVGLYFTIRTGFVQIRLLPDSVRVLLERKEKGKISSFQALMISTASRVGTGNIAGVSTAIVLGGSGAIFWMWLMAVIGSASAFIESTLAQVYKKKDGAQFRGGPAYYIEQALNARWLGIVFAVLLIATFAFGFNGLQSYTMTSTFEYYYGAGFADSMMPKVIGGLIAVGFGIILFGGSHRISLISSVLVPVMASLYIISGIIVFVLNISSLPEVISEIISGAFDFQAIAGGFAGSCVVIGIKRGLFSNEAGMGSAPNAAAAADVSHPVKQGMVQVLSVFIDTLLICSTTAFIILLSGVVEFGGELTAIPLMQQSMAANFGVVGIHFITVSVCLFAFTSLIGNYFYAEANIKFISQNKGLLFIFRLAAVLMVFVGAQVNLTTAWDLADVLMGCMATVNIFAMFALGGIAVRALKDYEEQKGNGFDPVFRASRIGLHNTDCWK